MARGGLTGGPPLRPWPSCKAPGKLGACLGRVTLPGALAYACALGVSFGWWFAHRTTAAAWVPLDVMMAERLDEWLPPLLEGRRRLDAIPPGALTDALRTLIGFERLSLVRPGATAAATLAVDPRTLGCVDNVGVRTLPAGTLSLEAGDVVAPAKHSVTLTGPDVVMPV